LAPSRFPGLVHQPDSLDDLDNDNDTIPFDTVPVRYDEAGQWRAHLVMTSLEFGSDVT
jgi:hypothetical protein